MAEFNRFRSGNNWVSARITDEEETVELLGSGYSTVSPGTVLVKTAREGVFENHSRHTFFADLKFRQYHAPVIVEKESTDETGNGDSSDE